MAPLSSKSPVNRLSRRLAVNQSKVPDSPGPKWPKWSKCGEFFELFFNDYEWLIYDDISIPVPQQSIKAIGWTDEVPMRLLAHTVERVVSAKKLLEAPVTTSFEIQTVLWVGCDNHDVNITVSIKICSWKAAPWGKGERMGKNCAIGQLLIQIDLQGRSNF